MELFLEFAAEQWMLMGALLVAIAMLINHESRKAGPAVSPQQAINLVNAESGVFVDLRDAAAFKQGHIVDAVHIPTAKLAARQGDTEAGKKRDEVANMLSTKDLAEARLSVENWTDQPRTPAANEVETKPSWTAPASSVSKASFTADPRELVMNVQRLLAARGFDPGTPDGQIGPRTREAVRAYQEAAGMRVTGAISTELLASLTGTAI